MRLMSKMTSLKTKVSCAFSVPLRDQTVIGKAPATYECQQKSAKKRFCGEMGEMHVLTHAVRFGHWNWQLLSVFVRSYSLKLWTSNDILNTRLFFIVEYCFFVFFVVININGNPCFFAQYRFDNSSIELTIESMECETSTGENKWSLTQLMELPSTNTANFRHRFMSSSEKKKTKTIFGPHAVCSISLLSSAFATTLSAVGSGWNSVAQLHTHTKYQQRKERKELRKLHNKKIWIN